jgi:hypothetical protein
MAVGGRFPRAPFEMELAGVLAKLERFLRRRRKNKKPPGMQIRAALFCCKDNACDRFLGYSRPRSVLLNCSTVSLPVTIRSKSELLT